MLCNTSINLPGTLKECYYTINPTCFDNIKNCHSGSCEVGIDCGGACEDCKTCSDKIKNQGEEGIDCGGPCIECKTEVPSATSISGIIVIALTGGFLIILLGVIWLIMIYLSKKKTLDKIAKKRGIDSA